jgi:hypothetical protein
VPSITAWNRLEPLPREASLARSLQAQVRDPLWMLARQWQVGEFAGEDAGSPVQAAISVESRALTGYRPGPGPAPAGPLDPGLALEAHVEREPVVLGLRGSVQLGLRFEALARAAGAAEADIASFRTAFPIKDPAADEIPDRVTARFRSLAQGRVTDGVALAGAVENGDPLPAAATPLTQVLQDFAAYTGSLYSEPGPDSAWQPRDLDYAFSVSAEAAAGVDQTVLAAPHFPGGRLDWYSFSPAPAPAAGPVQPPSATAGTGPDVQAFSFLPRHVTFHGMPNPRWWSFEDAATDFGQLDAGHTDLAKMLVMEFALVYGNDWFQLSFPVTAGSLVRVGSLVVTDTFGVPTPVGPADSPAGEGQPAWSMFKVGHGQQRLEPLFLPPVLGALLDGPVLEEVLFLRDEMAAMAWAVEQQIQGPMDQAVDGYEAWRLRMIAEGPPAVRPVTPGGPPVYYLLETTVPDNWIPLVPVRGPAGDLYFRRGIIERPSAAGPVPVLARSVILDPGHPFFVYDQSVPRAGADVTRRFRRTRWTGGSTQTWVARSTRPGRGPGWSGLAFDLVEETGQPPPEIQP